MDWFHARGVALPEISQVETRVSRDTIPQAFHPDLSDGQAEAVATVLRSGLSYIWGPPGTGKTQWILSKAVCNCVERNQKVLVLAPTNLAVDNALKAILNDGVEQSKVARIGIPSQNFISEYPDCCEQRAFQHEIQQTELQIRNFEGQIERLEAAREIQKQIDHDREMQRVNNEVVQKQRSDLATTERILHQRRLDAARDAELLRSNEEGISAIRREIRNLSFQEIQADIIALEKEQTRTIKKVEISRGELQSLGLLARWFTGRKKALMTTIVHEEAHLRSVEETMRGKREQRDAIAPRVHALEATLTDLTSSRDRQSNRVESIRGDIARLDRKKKDLEAEISRALKAIRDATEGIAKGEEELALNEGRLLVENAEQILAAWRADIARLKDRIDRYTQDITNKPVIGMTLDSFIGMTLQSGISVDHVFVDEAPYASLAKVLPLLSLRCPIAMLGDHCQLPPINQSDNNPVIRSYWAKPAIFLEDAFRFAEDYVGLNNIEEPQSELTQRCVLTESYRFGPTLAALLDQHVYNNIGLVGLGASDTTIRCIHCEPYERPGRERRVNDSEIDAMLGLLTDWWEWANQQPILPTIAILTPYKKQAKLIRSRLENALGHIEISRHIEVWNTHQAQGREWDWVLFSVSDTANLQGNEPFYSDTALPQGKALVSTTISRAKKHLRVFLDAVYWSNRPQASILTALAQDWVHTENMS